MAYTGKLVIDATIAEKVGYNAAAIYSHIRYWAERNKRAGKAQREGRFWSFASVARLAEIFDNLMSADQIRRALERLVKAGLLLKGFFGGMNRSAWYSPAEDRFEHEEEYAGQDAEEARPDLANMPNAFGTNAECIKEKEKEGVYTPPNPPENGGALKRVFSKKGKGGSEAQAPRPKRKRRTAAERANEKHREFQARFMALREKRKLTWTFRLNEHPGPLTRDLCVEMGFKNVLTDVLGNWKGEISHGARAWISENLKGYRVAGLPHETHKRVIAAGFLPEESLYQI